MSLTNSLDFINFFLSENLNFDKFLKLRLRYYTAIILSLNVITYFFGFLFGHFTITFFGLLSVFVQEIMIRKIVMNNTSFIGNNYQDFLLSLKAPIYMLLVFSIIPLILSLNIFSVNFNVAEDKLLKADGITISNTDNHGLNANYYVDITTSQNNTTKFIFNYMRNHMEYRKIAIPENEKVRVKYLIGQSKGGGKYDNLAYDIRSKDRIYLNYKEQKDFYISFQKKAIKNLILSTVLYVLSIFILFISLIHRIRS